MIRSKVVLAAVIVKNQRCSTHVILTALLYTYVVTMFGCKLEHMHCGRKCFVFMVLVSLVCFTWSLLSYNRLTITNRMYEQLQKSLGVKRVKDVRQITSLHFRPGYPVDKPVFSKNITVHNYTVTYEACMHIPKPPRGTNWTEDRFIHDPPITDLKRTVSPDHCTVRLKGPEVVKLGDRIRMRIELFDGYGNKRKGGDLVRVWMKEASLGAGSVAKVTDNMDGSYDAEFVAFWVGRPQIRVAIINPREVIAVQFKRRYMCPPVLMNTGDFEGVGGKAENTPCSYYPQIPGYSDICNLTQANYGRPWYCGKPRSKSLSCKDWTKASDKALSKEGFESHLLTPMDKNLLTRKYQAMLIPANITVQVKSSDARLKLSAPDLKCNDLDRRHTWLDAPPAGYLYQKQWSARSCYGRDRSLKPVGCLNNTKMVLIGDSTVRQMFSAFTGLMACKEGKPKITEQNKHTFLNCIVPQLNFTLEFRIQELPFCTTKTPLQYLKPLHAKLEQFHRSDGSKIVIVYHVFAHFLNYHSHVFYEGLKTMKAAIVSLLDSNPDVRFVLKGPHAYAFELNNPNKFVRFPEMYMESYIDMIKREFRDVQDRVAYLDVADITTATEQFFIHPEDYVVNELNNQLLDFVCPY